MLRRCLLLVLLASLAVSAPAAWAAGVFVNISATDGNAQVWPTGVSTSGAVSMQGLNTSGYDYTYYNIDYYPGGAGRTMSNVNALFNNAITSYSSTINDSGQFTPYIDFLGSPRMALFRRDSQQLQRAVQRRDTPFPPSPRRSIATATSGATT